MTLFRCCPFKKVSSQVYDTLIFPFLKKEKNFIEKSFLDLDIQKKLLHRSATEFCSSKDAYKSITFYDIACSSYSKVIVIYQEENVDYQIFSKIQAQILKICMCILNELNEQHIEKILIPVSLILEEAFSTVTTASVSFFISTFMHLFHQNTEKSDCLKSVISIKNLSKIAEITFVLNDDQVDQGNLECATQKAILLGLSQTQRLANLPANICTPEFLKNEVLSLKKRYPNTFSIVVHDKTALEKMGMNGILGVASGSCYPSYLLEIRYEKTASSNTKPIVLVGKGITFDSGGLSLKPANAMELMKYDMCGAAAVFGVFEALAELKLPISVIGLLPVCENMVSHNSYRPGDILTMFSGLTVEINNTDAEGRLILADALAYAEKFLNPKEIIDVATLTGACVVALGSERSGLFSNSEDLQNKLIHASNKSHDKVWPMPMDPEYIDLLRSSSADLSNCGRKREAGAISAACFLSKFVTATPWAHLDIAGTAYTESGGVRATGRPVPLLLSYLIEHTQSQKD